MMTIETPQRFTEETLRSLQQAGWFPGRNVARDLKLPERFDIHSIALKVLQEFAYLHVGQSGSGIDRAKRIVEFDPMLAIGEDDRFGELANLLNRRLYPLGEVGNGYYFLAIDEAGGLFLIMDHYWFVDSSFETGLDRLLTGKALKLIDDTGKW